MTEFLFDLTFYLAAPFWALMIFAPGWSWTKRIVSTPWIAAIPLVVYVIVAAPAMGDLWAVVSTPELGELREFLGTAPGAAAIWAHLIAFDLFVGQWIYRDARERGVHHALLAPILVLTILLSPFGLLAYLLVRAVQRSRDESSPTLNQRQPDNVR